MTTSNQSSQPRPAYVWVWLPGQTEPVPAGRGGQRDSTLATCREAADVYGLTRSQANQIIDHTVATIHDQWPDAAEAAHLTKQERTYLWHRQILNPFIKQKSIEQK